MAVLIKICFAFTGFKLPPNSENREHLKKISGVLFVYWPITIKFRMRKQTSKPQTNYRCCLQFSYLVPYWLIPHNTRTFLKYFWCSWFCEFHSKLQNIIRNKTQFQYKVEGGLHLGGL